MDWDSNLFLLGFLNHHTPLPYSDLIDYHLITEKRGAFFISDASVPGVQSAPNK